jgi:RNA polymerase sigma-70 factor (ECF subfamily)
MLSQFAMYPIPTMPDDDMIANARLDETLRGTLLEQFRGYLVLQSRRRMTYDMNSRVDPEDIVQATMLRASSAFESFEGTTPQQFFQWLMTIHRNTLTEELSWQHAAKRDPSKEQTLQSSETAAVLYWLEPTDGQPTPSVRMMKDEEALRVAEAMRQLNPDQSNAVRLRHLEGWSIDQIAEHLGKTPQAVSGLIKRGLANLREALLPPARV